MKIRLRTALQRLQCIFIILWKYSKKRRTRAAALIRGRRLLTIPLHVRRLIEGGTYSGAALTNHSAPCAALNRGRRLFGGGAYSSKYGIRVPLVFVIKRFDCICNLSSMLHASTRPQAGGGTVLTAPSTLGGQTLEFLM